MLEGKGGRKKGRRTWGVEGGEGRRREGREGRRKGLGIQGRKEETVFKIASRDGEVRVEVSKTTITMMCSFLGLFPKVPSKCELVCPAQEQLSPSTL